MKTITQLKNLLRDFRIAVLLLIALCVCSNAMAAGTEVLTLIENSATIRYQVGGIVQDDTPAAVATFQVDRKVDLTMSAPQTFATVTPGGQVVWPFTLTNEGNGDQGYRLNFQAGLNEFEATNVRIYIDNGAIGTFEAGTDTLYSTWSGGSETFAGIQRIGDLGNDEAMNLLVVADIPTGVVNTNVATYHLIATTVTAGSTGASGDNTIATGGDWNAMTEQTVFGDAAGPVDLTADGQYSTSVTFTISSASLSVSKTAEVTDDGLGTTGSQAKAIPGATVTYRITIVNSGSQPAQSVTIRDTLDTDTTFITGTVSVEINGIESTPTVSLDSGVLEIGIGGDIPNGQTADIYYNVTIK